MRKFYLQSVVVTAVSLAALFSGGCATGKGTGALAGSGVGALIGQAVGGDTTSTLVGAAIGTGVGYIIGDQADEKKAKEMAANNTPPEVAPLGGTRWKLVSLNAPSKTIEAYNSKEVEFKPDGHVVTTTVRPDTSRVIVDESYRVVGNTLIVHKPGYMVNARFRVEGNQLIVDDSAFSAVLERVNG